MKPGDIVKVKWIDSTRDGRVWVDLSNFNYDEHDSSMYQVGVGIFVKKTKDGLYLCSDVRADAILNYYVANLHAIPNRAVISMEILGRVG